MATAERLPSPPPAGAVADTAVPVAAIAELGALVGDPSRAAMLTELLDGRARTAGELAACAGVTAQTASSHLARLIDGGLVAVVAQGRCRYHRLASPEAASLLESLHAAGAALAPTRAAPRRLGPADAALREARTCYDHLAGRLAVALAESLAARDWVRFGADGAEPTLAGVRALEAWGVDVAAARAARRAFCRPCLDWSERRPHLAGSLAAAVLDRALAVGWVRRRKGTRALEVTPAGRAGFAAVFGARS